MIAVIRKIEISRDLKSAAILFFCNFVSHDSKFSEFGEGFHDTYNILKTHYTVFAHVSLKPVVLEKN